MRIALAGDAHGNLAAVRVALASMAEHDVELLLFTGDFVGYYYDGAEVVRTIRSMDAVCVRGNHDDMIAEVASGALLLDAVEAKYGHGLGRSIEQLDESEKAWLAALPVSTSISLGGCSILIAHGSATSNREYIYPDDPDLFAKVGTSDFDIAVLGHTHYRMRREFGSRVVINPGSIGQPRDGMPGAAWSLLNTDTGETQFMTEPYDWGPVARQAKELDPHLPYLWTVLGRT